VKTAFKPSGISKTAVLTEAISNSLTTQKKKKACEKTDYIILPYYGNMPGIGELEDMKISL